ncbi:MAG: ATP-binding protein [Cyanobacteria bacterium J06621_11]
MSNPNRSFNDFKSALPLKISLPFILMFLGVWIAGSAMLGQHFSNKLEQDQQEQSLELAGLVKREIEQARQNLRRSARLLARDESIVEAVSTADQRQLQKEVLPLKSVLETDIITVIDQERQSLIDIRQLSFRQRPLSYDATIDLMLAGSDISTVVGLDERMPPVMIGTSPIKDEKGVVGGILLGTVLSDELLIQINQSIQEHIVTINNGRVVSSTFSSEDVDVGWADVANSSPDSGVDESGGSGQEASYVVSIESELFLAQPISLEGINGKRFEVILLISQTPLIQSKHELWAYMAGLASLGALLIAILGYSIARKIAHPIQSATTVALKVVAESDFTLQIPVHTQDEIGLLSKSVNQLILWVGQYTDELELSAKTLETRVKQRTQELSETLGELQDTQAQLIQTEKMSSLGQMVAGIAHEINNPISFVRGNIKPLETYFRDVVDLLLLYEQTYPNPSEEIEDKREDIEIDFLLEDVDKIFGSMNMGTRRVQEIVVSLRNFSRLDESTIKDVDLREGIESTLLILNHRIKQGVEIIKNYADLPLVNCSPAQLNQVFTNIIANALDAMFDADVSLKQLTITTRTHTDDQVQVSIKDSGPGMPDEVKDKIFDPFFTTKPVGKGTGLGLGICFKIIQQHQGSVVVNSELDQGTEFLITLPRAPQFVLSDEVPKPAETTLSAV